MQTEHQQFIGIFGSQQLPKQPENAGIYRQRLQSWWSKRQDSPDCCCVRGREVDSYANRLILPGSFNPLHNGHLAMAATAVQAVARPCDFELSIANVDKPDLPIEIVLDRVQQPFGGHRLVVSNAARFTEKAEIFAGGTFVVGADTITRLVDPKYYSGSQKQCALALDKFERLNCRFLVFGRMLANKFLDSTNIVLDPRMRALCDFVDRDQFEVNISSTQLRSQQDGKRDIEDG